MNRQYVIAMAALALLTSNRAESQTMDARPEPVHSNETNIWSFTASAYGYIVPESRDYINPNFTADHDWLHLEARYNYEALETGSAWVGYNFSVGEELIFEITPMLGGVFGDLTGIAPGYNASLGYKRFLLSSQGEFFFDTGESDHFFYTWSEFTYSPWEWLRAGLVMQRTKAYQTDLDIQRGFLVGVSFKRIELTTYVFNLGWTDPTIVIGIGYSF
jgi:hypothetical protein